MLNARQLIGTHDVLFITLDTLRYDVACDALAAGQTPNLAALLPDRRWEKRHSPGSFTYAAHHAFFAGFLPTPASPGPHPRLFAAHFEGSETTTEDTVVFEDSNIASGLAAWGYHSVCIGGVGFFNKQTALGSVLPNLFQESHWCPEMGVTSKHSTEHQVRLALKILQSLPITQRVFLFLNVSALHQPNCIFATDEKCDSARTQGMALSYVDRHLAPLFAAMQRRAPVLTIICSDHGTTYGEDGFEGHRLAHEVVWTVPYAEFILPHQSTLDIS